MVKDFKALCGCARVCRKAKAIEYMVVDALLLADASLKFSDKIYEPSQFKHLDDTILKQVRWQRAEHMPKHLAL